jgi:CDP-paratose 2-epimerase
LKSKSILITGGAGFIGTNVARSYLQRDQPVHILDNLARSGVERNIRELQQEFPGRVQFSNADVRDRKRVVEAVETASAVYHLAAQVAVTTSLDNPMDDLETNLIGTMRVLEAVRESKHRPSVLFTSTNKVYGRLGSLSLCEGSRRHEPVDQAVAASGIAESQPLEFLSPYGCSKGSADQYVLDYAHSYGLRACVFRMSCIYGTYQLGSEDQGWVAHFLRQALKGEPVTIYGDGKQVRDLLFVDDLVRAMHSVHEQMDLAAGHAFNMGGGRANSTSLLDLLDEIRLLTGTPVNVEWGTERLADQRWFVADTSKMRNLLGWSPRISIREGLRKLTSWYLSRSSVVDQAAIGRSAVQVA